MNRSDRRLIRIILVLTAFSFLLVSCEAYVLSKIDVLVIRPTRAEL